MIRGPITIAPADPLDTAAQTCLASYFAELDRRFESGFTADPRGGDLDAMRPPTGAFLVASRRGLPVGCVALVGDGSPVAEVKRLWVAPAARGTGLARRLMAEVEALARGAGIATLRLDTNRALTEAIALYRALGWHEIARYNDNPHAHAWFEKRLAPEVVAATGEPG